MSLSNLSSFFSADEQVTLKRPSRIRRPSLPRVSSFRTVDVDHPELEPPVFESSQTPESGISTPSTDITTPSKLSDEDEAYGDILQDKGITEDEKLKAIAEEFGNIATLMEGDEKERMLAESKGSLFKCVRLGNSKLSIEGVS